MKKKFRLQLPQVLFILAIGTVLINLVFAYSPLIHIETVIGFVVLYISFSLLHHYLEKSLTVTLMLEYILIAAFVMVMVISVER